MPSTSARSELHVEGTNDRHSIANLVKKHGIEFDKDRRVPEIKPIGSVEGLLNGVKTAVKASTGRAVGFVLDADAPLASRWQSVHDRLVGADVDSVPDTPPREGFIGVSSRFKSRVGVWLMPDNQSDGSLESFLMTLIRDDDPLIRHADQATDRAKELGAAFIEVDRSKAILHAWLAWQLEPGCPYGTAISAGFFAHDVETAAQFVRWYVSLYELSEPVGR
jgi:hypothetical protein